LLDIERAWILFFDGLNGCYKGNSMNDFYALMGKKMS